MTILQKLMIRGIRSYNPSIKSYIEFSTPLTIILGVNGSGKTTIIESLKYVTTGELPSNTKGGAFVYDPKIIDVCDVKGQIKLQFQNVHGDEVVVTRSLQSTVRPNGSITQRSIESTILVKRKKENVLENCVDNKQEVDGSITNQYRVNKSIDNKKDFDNRNEVSTSNRCANINIEVEDHLKIIPSILEYVTFCHQEDSNWLLSEPGVVKKKFDEIFATTKYSKAIENTKSLRKTLKERFDRNRMELGYLLEKKTKKDKLLKQIEGEYERRAIIEDKINECEIEIGNIDLDKIRETIRKEESREILYRRIQNEIESLKTFKINIEINDHEILNKIEKYKMKINEIDFEDENYKFDVDKKETRGIKQDLNSSFFDFSDSQLNLGSISIFKNLDFTNYFNFHGSILQKYKNEENKLNRELNILQEHKPQIIKFKTELEKIKNELDSCERKEMEIISIINESISIKVQNYSENIILKLQESFREENIENEKEKSKLENILKTKNDQLNNLKGQRDNFYIRKTVNFEKLKELEKQNIGLKSTISASERILAEDGETKNKEESDINNEENFLVYDEIILLNLEKEKENLEDIIEIKQTELNDFYQNQANKIISIEKNNKKQELEMKIKNIKEFLIDKHNENYYDKLLLFLENNEFIKTDEKNISKKFILFKEEFLRCKDSFINELKTMNFKTIPENYKIQNNIQLSICVDNKDNIDSMSSSDSFLDFSDDKDNNNNEELKNNQTNILVSKELLKPHKNKNEEAEAESYAPINSTVLNSFEILINKAINILKKNQESNKKVETQLTSHLFNSKKIFATTETSKIPITDYLLKEETTQTFELEEKIKDIENKISISTNASHLYKNFMKKSLKSNSCELCKRKFNGNEKEDSIKRIEFILSKIPEKKENTSRELVEFIEKKNIIETENTNKREKNKKYEALRCILYEIKQLLPTNKFIGHLNRISELGFSNEKSEELDFLLSKFKTATIERFIKYLEKSISTCDDIFMNHLSNLNEITVKITELIKINEESSLIMIDEDQLEVISPFNVKIEINQIKSKICEIKNKINKMNLSKERKNIENVKKEIKQIQIKVDQVNNKNLEIDIEINSLGKVIEEINIEIESQLVKFVDLKDSLTKNEINHEHKIHMIQKLKNEFKKNKERNINLHRDLREKVDKLIDVFKMIDGGKNVYENNIKRLKKDNNINGNKNDDNIMPKKHLADKNINYNNRKMSVNDNLSFLADFSSSFHNENIENNSKENITDIETQISLVFKTIEAFFDEINNLQQEIINIRKIYNDKYDLINGEKEEIKIIEENIKKQEIEAKIKEYEEEINKIDIIQINEMRKEFNEMEEKRSQMSAEMHVLIGEKKQLEKSIDLKNKDLDDYLTIDEAYTKSYIENETIKLIKQDVETCLKALERRLIEYHTEKIDEINRILKELWVETYKGNDIDYIKIKSETFENKAYNYRIDMVKNDVEIEFRGRCSSGQKVLACILARMALSDVFSTNFPVLALDEPTTNLDKENIEALAETLSRLIKNRSQNNDFQLIIITHDKRFIEMLNQECCESFYFVDRDQNGDSMIIKKKLF